MSATYSRLSTVSPRSSTAKARSFKFMLMPVALVGPSREMALPSAGAGNYVLEMADEGVSSGAPLRQTRYASGVSVTRTRLARISNIWSQRTASSMKCVDIKIVALSLRDSSITASQAHRGRSGLPQMSVRRG